MRSAAALPLVPAWPLAHDAGMDATTRRSLIDRYREGPEAVRAALEGAGTHDLDARPAPGEWTAREIVHHLADSETASTIRLRRLLAEDAPHIIGYHHAQTPPLPHHH